MEGKIHQQFFDSSVMDESVATRYVFMCLIVLADKHGIVDVTQKALSRRIAVPPPTLSRALARLTGPDPESRTPDHDGRRIVPLDPERSWGWKVVNAARYARLSRRKAKLRRDRDRQRQRRALGANRPEETRATKSDGKLRRATESDGKLRKATVSPPQTPPLRGGYISSAELPKSRALTRPQADLKAISDVFEHFGAAKLKGNQHGAWAKRLKLYRQQVGRERGHSALLADLESCGRASYIGSRGKSYVLKVIDSLIEGRRCGQGVPVPRSRHQDPSASSLTVARASALDEEPDEEPDGET